MNPAYKPTPFIPSASDSIARRWRDATTLSAAAHKSYYRQILIIGRLRECQAPRSRLTRRRQLQSGLVQIEPTKPRRE